MLMTTSSFPYLLVVLYCVILTGLFSGEKQTALVVPLGVCSVMLKYLQLPDPDTFTGETACR